MIMVNIYLFSGIVILWAFMDFICFQRPYNSGYFSLHTYGLRFDAWHHSKILILFLITYSMIGYENLLDYVWFALIALVGQLFFYNFLFKKLFRGDCGKS